MRSAALAGIVAAAAVYIALHAILALAQGEQMVNWITYINSTTTYPYVPVHVSVAAYDTSIPSVLPVRCNFVVSNASSVLDVRSIYSPRTVSYSFAAPAPGVYTINMYCVSSLGNSTSKLVKTFKVSVVAPPVTVKPLRLPFATPTTVEIVSGVRYTGVPLTVELNGTSRRLVLVNGSAALNVTLYQNATLKVTIFGKTYAFNLTVPPVHVLLNAPTSVAVGECFNATPVVLAGHEEAAVPVTVKCCGESVETVSGKPARLCAPRAPGTYNLTAETHGYRNTTKLVVERRPTHLRPEEETLPAGEQPHTPYPWYRSGGLVVAHFPGNETNQPADLYIIVNYTWPRLNVTEGHVYVADAAPGANLTVICYEWNSTLNRVVPVIALQAHLNSTSYTASFNDTCLYVEAVYRYGTVTIREMSNEPEPVRYLRACSGACIPVYPSAAIASVTIDGEVYVPGTRVTLPPGPHLVEIHLRDGYVVSYTLIVGGRRAVVYVDAFNPSRVLVKGCSVYVVLSNGAVLKVPTGRWVSLPGRVVYAFAPGCKVSLVRLYTTR